MGSPGVVLDEKLAFDFDRHDPRLKRTSDRHPYGIRSDGRNINASDDAERVSQSGHECACGKSSR
jgi:hypothetical protein